MTYSTYIRSIEEPEMTLSNQGGGMGTHHTVTPVLPFIHITDKDRDDWNAKWGGGEGAESAEEMEGDTEQGI